ncbi:MAG: SGNH/GDSL hydrolase family protein [Candidatus Hydrogenedentes bacterium]|nr:SGNH/GDSL hydrolase family protein [Candidatus Hydrogenedentota bacterium]
MRWAILASSFLLLSAIAALACWLLGKKWKAQTALRTVAINCAVLVFTLLYMAMALEAYFYSFVQTDGFGFTLAAKRWHERYWHPVNSLNYRDVEHAPEDLRGKKTVIVLGDSIAAGWGVKDVHDRFSNVLARQLGAEAVVVNLAQSGWDTPQELSALKAYPYTPDTVILQYFVNDIKHAALASGADWVPAPDPPEGALRTLVEHSYFLNYAYWRVRRTGIKQMSASFWERRKSVYANEELWTEHAQVFSDLAQYAADSGITLFVVIFPYLLKVEDSASITGRVADAFEALGVPVLDLTPRFSGRDPKDLVCNALDGHPNERVHREVGELLHEMLTGQEGQGNP